MPQEPWWSPSDYTDRLQQILLESPGLSINAARLVLAGGAGFWTYMREKMLTARRAWLFAFAGRVRTDIADARYLLSTSGPETVTDRLDAAILFARAGLKERAQQQLHLAKNTPPPHSAVETDLSALIQAFECEVGALCKELAFIPAPSLHENSSWLSLPVTIRGMVARARANGLIGDWASARDVLRAAKEKSEALTTAYCELSEIELAAIIAAPDSPRQLRDRFLRRQSAATRKADTGRLVAYERHLADDRQILFNPPKQARLADRFAEAIATPFVSQVPPEQIERPDLDALVETLSGSTGDRGSFSMDEARVLGAPSFYESYLLLKNRPELITPEAVDSLRSRLTAPRRLRKGLDLAAHSIHISTVTMMAVASRHGLDEAIRLAAGEGVIHFGRGKELVDRWRVTQDVSLLNEGLINYALGLELDTFATEAEQIHLQRAASALFDSWQVENEPSKLGVIAMGFLGGLCSGSLQWYSRLGNLMTNDPLRASVGLVEALSRIEGLSSEVEAVRATFALQLALLDQLEYPSEVVFEHLSGPLFDALAAYLSGSLDNLEAMIPGHPTMARDVKRGLDAQVARLLTQITGLPDPPSLMGPTPAKWAGGRPSDLRPPMNQRLSLLVSKLDQALAAISGDVPSDALFGVDAPLLIGASGLPAAYIGALAERSRLLRERRWTDAASASYNAMMAVRASLENGSETDGHPINLSGAQLRLALAGLAHGAEAMRLVWRASLLIAEDRKSEFIEESLPGLLDETIGLALVVGEPTLVFDLLLNSRISTAAMSRASHPEVPLPRPVSYRGLGWLGMPTLHRIAFPQQTSAAEVAFEPPLALEQLLASDRDTWLGLGVVGCGPAGSRIVAAVATPPNPPVVRLGRIGAGLAFSPAMEAARELGSAVLPFSLGRSTGMPNSVLNVSWDPRLPGVAVGAWVLPDQPNRRVGDYFDVVYRTPPSLGWLPISSAGRKGSGNHRGSRTYWVCDPTGDLPWSGSCFGSAWECVGHCDVHGQRAADRRAVLSLIANAARTGGVFIYQGHASATGTASTGISYDLLVHPQDPLSAGERLSLEDIFKVVSTTPGAGGLRMLLLGCETSSSMTSTDLGGFATSLLAAGVDIVVSTLRPIPEGPLLQRAVEELAGVLQATSASRDFAAWQRTWLTGVHGTDGMEVASVIQVFEAWKVEPKRFVANQNVLEYEEAARIFAQVKR